MTAALRPVAQFLFEVGMLRRTPRSGLQFLGSGDDSVAIRRLFTAKLCAFIDANADWAIESTGAWIAVCRKRVRPEIDAYHAFVGEAAEFLRAFGTRR